MKDEEESLFYIEGRAWPIYILHHFAGNLDKDHFLNLVSLD